MADQRPATQPTSSSPRRVPLTTGDVPRELVGTGDVGAVCVQHGLRLVQHHPLDPAVWLDDAVKVQIVEGFTAWRVTVRVGMGGLLVCEVGAETRPAELLHLAIAEARRIHAATTCPMSTTRWR